MKILLNYIDGTLKPPVSGEYLDNINPARGEVYAKIPDSDARDVADAVDAARRAFPAWAGLPAEKRSDFLLSLADLVDSHVDELALAESIDTGKPLALAKHMDIARASVNLRFYATAILHFASSAHPMEGLATNYTVHRPVGVAGCISPWNLPLYLFTWKIAPALAAGNCVVAKPSELAPMTAFLFSELCIQAGMPAGVLNIVHGLGAKAGQAIVEHPEVPLISFTGGSSTGKRIAVTAAPMLKRLSLELGGKNPTIVFSDCDFDEAVKNTVRSSFLNQGEICLCGSRIFVERKIYGKFKRAFLQEVAQLSIGDPLHPDTFIGAVISEAHAQKVMDYIQLAKEEGGNILIGGKRHLMEKEHAGGFFILPTVIEGLSYDCRCNQEEIFGPVVSIMPFDTMEEVLHDANSTPYGLAANIWTLNVQKAHQVAQQLDAGIVWVNCWLLRDLRTPFGGVKQSGIGREGGFEALQFFTESKNICIKH